MNKQAENIDRLTDFALSSFGIENTMKDERDKEVMRNYIEKMTEGEPRFVEDAGGGVIMEDDLEDDGHDYEYEKWRDYKEQNMPSN